MDEPAHFGQRTISFVFWSIRFAEQCHYPQHEPGWQDWSRGYPGDAVGVRQDNVRDR